MIRTRLALDLDFAIGELDRRIFGVLIEHVGRCVYTGIYEPGHPSADARGLRGDVLALARELGVTIARYPGGNFVSAYRWEDGVGPPADRPVRLDPAWHSSETNQFGTDEFVEWCRAAGAQPMLAVNLGTRGADAAARLVEYCNHPGGSAGSELRRSHGCDAPHDVRHWCLGNEMDAPWQIGQKTAPGYGRLASDAARLMRRISPGLQLTACGSSNRDLPTFGTWEHEVLQECFDEVDLLSVHAYFENPHADSWEFLGNIDGMDLHIREVAAIADAVAAQRHSRKRIMLAVDEWNVWYKARTGAHAFQPGWPRAPRLLEEVYNFEDALAAGGALCVLMNNADRVKVACLAQLVNALGAIRTQPGGPAWRQTIFHPFALAARHARGRVLRPAIESPCGSGRAHPRMPYLVASATHDAEAGQVAVFALNRHLREEQDFRLEVRGLRGPLSLAEAIELHHADLKACNTQHLPEQVAPAAHGGVQLQADGLRARLKPGSWNVFVLRAA